MLAFSGFEAAAPLAEEAKDPRRTIRRAVLGATLGIGVVYIFTTYAAAVFFGPDRFATFGTAGSASWEGIARGSYGLFWVLVFFAVVNSCIANANAGANVSTRTAFSLGRIGIFPASFVRLHPRHRSPVVVVVVVVAIYIIVNAACIGFFTRHRRSELNVLLHIVFPLLGIAAFVPALLIAAGIPVFSFVSPLAAPISCAGPVVGVWMVAGLAYLGYLWARHRQRVVDTGLVHLDAEPPATDPQTTDPQTTDEERRSR